MGGEGGGGGYNLESPGSSGRIKRRGEKEIEVGGCAFRIQKGLREMRRKKNNVGFIFRFYVPAFEMMEQLCGVPSFAVWYLYHPRLPSPTSLRSRQVAIRFVVFFPVGQILKRSRKKDTGAWKHSKYVR